MQKNYKNIRTKEKIKKEIERLERMKNGRSQLQKEFLQNKIQELQRKL